MYDLKKMGVLFIKMCMLSASSRLKVKRNPFKIYFSNDKIDHWTVRWERSPEQAAKSFHGFSSILESLLSQ